MSDELGINESVGCRATHFCLDLGDSIIRHYHKESTYWTDKLLDRGITGGTSSVGKYLLLQKGESEQWLLEILWS